MGSDHPMSPDVGRLNDRKSGESEDLPPLRQSIGLLSISPLPASLVDSEHFWVPLPPAAYRN